MFSWSSWRWLISIFIGAAIAGPICLLLNEALLSVRAGVVFGSVILKELESLRQVVLVARYGFMVYLPFMWIHALATNQLARRGHDTFAWSLLSGSALSIPIAVIVTWDAQKAIFQQFGGTGLKSLLLIYLPFIATGILVGLLHWCISVRPMRQWRLQVEVSKAAIRAME
jgi:hypothetical protein